MCIWKVACINSCGTCFDLHLTVPKIPKISNLSNKKSCFDHVSIISFHVSTFYQFQRNMLRYQWVRLWHFTLLYVFTSPWMPITSPMLSTFHSFICADRSINVCNKSNVCYSLDQMTSAISNWSTQLINFSELMYMDSW